MHLLNTHSVHKVTLSTHVFSFYPTSTFFAAVLDFSALSNERHPGFFGKRQGSLIDKYTGSAHTSPTKESGFLAVFILLSSTESRFSDGAVTTGHCLLAIRDTAFQHELEEGFNLELTAPCMLLSRL